jgi:hypothetical protein
VLNWLKRRMPPSREEVARAPDVTRAAGGRQAGKYRLLYEYLEGRYAHTVVLTFAEMESLMGFALPEVARTDPTWWTVADASMVEPRCSPAWILASRSAKPNLVAGTVIFERTT